MSKPMDMKRTSEWVNDCPGDSCTGCGSPECYAMGGKVDLKSTLIAEDDNTNSTPIYSTQGSASGQPQAGYGHDWNKNSNGSYSMDDYADPKTWRKNRVAQAYSKGGRIADSTNPKSKLKGIHQKPDWEPSEGKSYAGSSVRSANTSAGGRHGGGQGAHEEAVDSHREVLGEMKSMKKPNLYAEGGEVEMGDDEMDTALSDAACGELLESIEKKDKAGILEAIRALVLSVR